MESCLPRQEIRQDINPDFKGSVKTVQTRDFWPDPAKSAKEQGFHCHQNAGIYTPGGELPWWSEFRPALMKLDLTLETTAGGVAFADRRAVRFGMREFTRDGNRLLINGRPVFLRGRLDCANYPLTGGTPMTVEEWRRIFKITKAWGINHYRFHSWCPPSAAFEAADELGTFLQADSRRGAMLICAIDLPGLQDHPEARQLHHSLLRHVASPEFAPRHAIAPELLQKLLPE